MNKKVISLILVMLLAITSTGVNMAKTTDDQNPYVRQYLEENSLSIEENSTAKLMSLNNNLNDEDQLVISYLQDYYNDDLKVAEVLSQYCPKSVSDKTLSLEQKDKIDIMHIIEVKYPFVNSKQKDILKGYLKRYAKCSNDNRAISFLNQINKVKKRTPNSLEEKYKKNEETSKEDVKLLSYVNAGDWAYDNYDQYSTDFPAFTKWGSDCTNFVSQALYYGGSSMDGDWYCYKKNSKYLVPRSETELNYSWDLEDPSPWISVKEFRNYWEDECETYLYSYEHYKNRHEDIFDEAIYKGDAVILHKGLYNWVTIPTHAMIISRYDHNNNDFKLAGHSRERQALPCLTAIENYAAIEFFAIRN